MSTFSISPYNSSKLSLIFLVIVFLVSGCDQNETNVDAQTGIENEGESKPGYVTVTTTNMNFDAPDQLPAGWTTFTYDNQSPNTHFFLLEKYPEGKYFADAEKDVIPVFQKAMDTINKGNMDAGMQIFGTLPEWFFKVQMRGGPGLISPGKKAEVTFNLEPGYYIMECYVKMPNGMFHSAMGMLKEIRVTDDSIQTNVPQATVEVNISSEKGIEFDKNIPAGSHVFAVNFTDQKQYENFLGHDVHLVKLEEGADVNTLNKWINWLNPEGLISPAPNGFTFMGGTQELPAGNTAYFPADLTPGKYALVAEIMDPLKKNMLVTFTIGN